MNNSPPLRPQAAKELLRRRQARRRLEDFTAYTYPRYIAEPAHALLAAKLDAVVRGEITRLMVFAPPQHGKSELCSVRLPALWLGNRPEDPVILASYAASLAESKSRQARQVVEGMEFARLFPGLNTRRDSRAVNHWELDGHRGGMLAVGVGGPVTGHGGMIGIIDDPMENWEQAQSRTMRDRVWEWWRSTFRTRIWERGAIVLIMTRWHQDDLAGRLLNEQGSEWEVLRLTAVAEDQAGRDASDRLLGLPVGQPDPLGRAPGEPLCPRRFSLPALDALRRDVGSMAWTAEYQGVPREPEGAVFKRDWFKRYMDGGDCYRMGDGWQAVVRKAECVVLDPAATEKETSDFTAIGVFALTPLKDLLLLHMVRERLGLEQIVPRLAQVCAVYGPSWVGIEGTGFQVGIYNEAKKWPGLPPIKQLTPEGKGKLVRATPAVVKAEAGQIYLPTRADWLDAFEEELLQFTGNSDRFDDQADCLFYAVHETGQWYCQPAAHFDLGFAVEGHGCPAVTGNYGGYETAQDYRQRVRAEAAAMEQAYAPPGGMVVQPEPAL
jgi:predicted phage terminase large subunit-like protein